MNANVRRERNNAVTPNSNTAGLSSGRGAVLTPPQRAAVIIALLGDTAAKPIVGKLDDAALSKIALSLETITYLSREDLVEIVIDFLTQLRNASGAMRGGKARARQVISGIIEPARMNSVFGGQSEETAQYTDEGDAWTRLSLREPRIVADYLSRLTPNIIALILRRLDASVTSNILCHLSEEKLGPALGQMVEAPKTDPGIDSVICRMIEIEFLNLPREAALSDESHLETIGEVLSLIPSDKRDNLVGFLRSQYESKLPIIQKGLFTVEGLPDILPRNAVPVVFKELDQAAMLKLLATLQGPFAAVSEYLLGNISSRMADQYREDLKTVPAAAQDEAETIQREFLTSIMDMRRRGLIATNKPAKA